MKLWIVNIERTLMVLAETEDEAEALAQRSEAQEAVANDPDFIAARECQAIGDVPKAWRNCYPYGADTTLNCEELINAVSEKEGL